jgi:hypothetical protein
MAATLIHLSSFVISESSEANHKNILVLVNKAGSQGCNFDSCQIKPHAATCRHMPVRAQACAPHSVRLGVMMIYPDEPAPQHFRLLRVWWLVLGVAAHDFHGGSAVLY